MKKLVTLAVALSALISIGQVELSNNHASASVGLHEDPTPSPEPGSGSVTAHKFHDVNTDGVQGKDEENIAGWLFRLYKLSGGLQLVAEGVTGPDGDVTFSDLPAGRYKLWEELPECWSPTTAGGHYWNGGYYLVGDLVAGQQVTISFGNVYTCSPPPETCIDLEKIGPETAYPGDTITYHFWVHNCGDIILAGGAHVYDTLFGEDAIWDGDLEPDEIHEFDMAYTLPQDLCDDATGNTEFTNNAWAIGHPPGYPEVRDDDSWTIEVLCGPEPNPSIDIEKSTNGEDADTAPGPYILAGGAVEWEYVVTNTGNITLTGVVITDSVLGEICIIDSLAIDESRTCTANGTAEAGQYENVGTATGESLSGKVSASDPSHYFGAAPDIDIEKLVSVDDQITWLNTPPVPEVLVGESVWFRFVVTNTGNVTLTEMFLSDDHFDTQIINQCTVPDELAPTDWFVCEIGPLPAEKGPHTNIATVTANYSDDYSEERYEDSDEASYFGADPSIDIEKFTNGVDADEETGPEISVGQEVNWEYVVTNTGNITLIGVLVTDDQGVTVSCPQTTLEPDDAMTCTSSAAAVAGQYGNIGTATGTPTVGGDVSASDSSHYLGVTGPSITVEKEIRVEGCEADWEKADTQPGPPIVEGANIYFQFTVTNTGNVPLTNITLRDNYPGFNEAISNTCTYIDQLINPEEPLNPGGVLACTIGPFPAEQGQHTNTATATGDYDGETYSDEDDANYFGAAIDVEKYVSIDGDNWEDADTPETGPEVEIGENVWFSFVVTNTGNIPAYDVTLSDDHFDAQIGEQCAVPDELAAGDSFVCQIEPLQVNETEPHVNTATASGYYIDAYCGSATSTDTDAAHYLGVESGGGEDDRHYVYLPLVFPPPPWLTEAGEM